MCGTRPTTPAFAHSAATTFFTSASSTAGSIATRAFTIRSASCGLMFDGSESFAAVSLLTTLPTAKAPASSMPISLRCATSPPRFRHTIASSSRIAVSNSSRSNGLADVSRAVAFSQPSSASPSA